MTTSEGPRMQEQSLGEGMEEMIKGAARHKRRLYNKY